MLAAGVENSPINTREMIGSLELMASMCVECSRVGSGIAGTDRGLLAHRVALGLLRPWDLTSKRDCALGTNPLSLSPCPIAYPHPIPVLMA